MAVFRYEAELLPNRELIRGLIEAADEATAFALLERQNLTEVRFIIPQTRHTPQQKPTAIRRLRLEDQIAFFRNMSKMLTAGIPIAEALQKQVLRFNHRGFQTALTQIRQEILSGTTLETAMAAHPQYFDTFAVRIIGIGERAGEIDHIMARLSHMYGQQLTLRKKLLSAAIIPLFTLAAFGLLGLVFCGVLFPVFQNIDTSLGLQTPLISVLDILSRFWYLPLAVLVIGAGGVWAFFRTEFGQAVMAESILMFPVFRHLVIQSQCAQFLSALHLTYGAGISISEGVGLAMDSLTNHAIQERFFTLCDLVEQGVSLAEALPQSDTILSESVLDLLITGDETGQLDSSMATAVQETDAEVQLLLDQLPDQMKPVMTTVLFLMLAGLLSLIYGTIFSVLTNAFNRIGLPH